ncbi:hypothetical protein F5Y19DRAFT_481741 [Xylariaceae sp. FL1651]|nr:hypothetical protein F5Y19DRAFT_481741 [Xylariaceae sp. FL1651]
MSTAANNIVAVIDQLWEEAVVQLDAHTQTIKITATAFNKLGHYGEALFKHRSSILLQAGTDFFTDATKENRVYLANRHVLTHNLNFTIGNLAGHRLPMLFPAVSVRDEHAILNTHLDGRLTTPGMPGAGGLDSSASQEHNYTMSPAYPSISTYQNYTTSGMAATQSRNNQASFGTQNSMADGQTGNRVPPSQELSTSPYNQGMPVMPQSGFDVAMPIQAPTYPSLSPANSGMDSITVAASPPHKRKNRYASTSQGQPRQG